MTILKYAAEGTLLATAIAFSGPGLGIALQRQMLKSLRGDSGTEHPTMKARRRQRERIRMTLNRLAEQQLVRLVDTDAGMKVEITVQGKALADKEAAAETLRTRSVQWDEKWRIVLFDIPETKRYARDGLRELLKGVGFYVMQQSVLVTPRPCEQEVEQLATYWEIEQYVTCAVAEKLGAHEERARVYFGIPPIRVSGKVSGKKRSRRV